MDGSSMTEQTSQTNLKQAIKYPERKINDWFTAHHMMNVKQDILRAPHCGLTPRKSYRADLSSRVVRKGWPRDHYLHHDEMAERDDHLRRIQRIDEIMRRSSPSVLHEDYPFSIRRILETDTTELVEPVRPHHPSIHPRDVSRHDYLEQRTVYAPPIHRQRTTSRHEQDFESYCNVDGCSKCGVTYPRYRAIPHPFLDLSRHRQPTISTLNTERKDEKVFVPSHTDIKQQKQVKSKKHKVPSSRKRKRHRTAFTPTQLLGLENSFERGHYLVGDERRQLAQFLRLSETQIKVWFQNRRTKWKRQRNALFEGTDLSDESDVSEIDE